MPRVIGREAPALSLGQPNPLTLRLRTITPMFGGSATPREVDLKNPIRPASVRGHLRFWWRATAGARYSTLEELFKAEEEIWGSAEKYGKVALRVVEQQAGESKKPSELVPDKGTARTGPMERFFLHPFNPNQSEGLPETSGLLRVDFTLELEVTRLSQEERDQLTTALRAWIAFGGVGARTRRGLGALEALSDVSNWLPAGPDQLKNWFAASPIAKPQHTTLAGAVVYLGQPSEPRNNDPYKYKGHAAWRKLGKIWARFRKGHYLDPKTGRTMEYTPMEGGKWRDHNTLKNLSPHQQQIELVKPYLGLPIVYQRFVNASKAFAGTLEAAHSQGKRMASPVILKPMAFADGSVRPALVILNAPVPEQIKIGEQKLELQIPEYDSVMKALEADDALEAVRKAALLEGFTQEVKL